MVPAVGVRRGQNQVTAKRGEGGTDAVNSGFVLALVALHVAGLVGPAWSQVVQTSALSGRVFDASAAVIREADVTLRGPFLLDGERRTTTDERGRYRFPALMPGTYLLTASADGFSPSERGDILVQLGESRVVDFQLEVGSRTEEVTVASRVPLVDVQASAISTHLDQDLLSNLPVSRTYADLIDLAPGVALGVAFGGTESSNALYINGVQTTDPHRQFPIVQINHNWIEQVEVTALGADAEFGGFTGGVANGLIKSGTNRFSGLADYRTTRPGWVSANGSAPREILSLYEITAQIGGPIITDRLWFFSGTEFKHENDRPAFFSGAGSTILNAPGFITRLDAALSDGIHVDAMYRYEDSDATATGLGRFGSLETSSDVVRLTNLWNARASWAASTRTLVEARTGGYTWGLSVSPRPPNTRLGPPPTLFQGMVTGTALTFNDNDRSRADVAVSLTRYEEIAGQAHDLKVGVELERTATLDRNGFNGGMIVLPTPTPGMTAFLLWDGETDETHSRRAALYLQDRWSVHDRLTLNLGLRLDLNRAAVPLRGTVFSTNPVSPRAGLAWALTPDYATVIRAHYGRYHDAILTNAILALDTSNQNPQIVELELPDGQRFEVSRIPPPALNTSVDRDIQHSYVDQYVVGIERELLPSFSMQLQYMRRDFDQFMGTIDANTEWTPREVFDPGPDGIFDSGDDGGPVTVFEPSTEFADRQFLYTNPRGAFRQYDAIQLIGTKRYSANWQMQASYTWARSEATVGNLQGTNAGQHELGSARVDGGFGSPNQLLHAVGEAPWTINELKVLGTYRVPVWGGVSVSGVYRYHSGPRWGRTFVADSAGVPFRVRAEPVGTRRLPAIANIDLRVEKTFGVIGTSGTAGLFVDVLNLSNVGAALRVDTRSGPNFGAPLVWTAPRTVSAGLRYMF